MLGHPTLVLVSDTTVLADAIEAGLLNSGFLIRRVNSADAALEALRGPEVSIAILDAEIPGMAIEQLLADIHAGSGDRRFPIVLIADEGISEWKNLLEEGAIDDLCPKLLPPFHWRARVEIALRTFRRARELNDLRTNIALNRGIDPPTGLYNRTALLSMLFRETDRVQRMNTPLSVMRFDIGDVAQWQSRMGAGCDNVLKQVAERVQRLLRSYDLFARVCSAGFVLGLPGCTPVNAAALAERILEEVFHVPFRSGTASVRLTACFGIAPSYGRSPLIVLRDAERALEAATASGSEKIRSAGDCAAKKVCSASAAEARNRQTG